MTSTRRLMKIAGLGLFAVIFVFAFIGWPSNVIHHDGAHMSKRSSRFHAIQV